MTKTLPRNFTFIPRTPPSVDHLDDAVYNPPEPPRQRPPKYQIRRRRNAPAARPRDAADRAHPSAAGPAYDSDVPLPTVEVSDDSLLLSPPVISKLPVQVPFSPPKTPAEQLIGNADQIVEASRAWEYDWEKQPDNGTMSSRPSTAYSRGTNSSIAFSIESVQSDATTAPSPDLVPVDSSKDDKAIPGTSPLDSKGYPSQTHVRMRINPAWTYDMDNHLWLTYLRYLEDPTHTPFKMLPGTAPPAGVCERVAREARRTWKAGQPVSTYKRHFSLGLLKDKTRTRHASASPERRLAKAQWPRSDAAVRRRLKDLCRGEPMLAPHYARLLYRTPSPFQSSSQPALSTFRTPSPLPQSSSHSAPSSPPPAPKRLVDSSTRASLRSFLPQSPLESDNAVSEPEPAPMQAALSSAVDPAMEELPDSTPLNHAQSSEDSAPRPPGGPAFSPGDSAFSTREMNLSLATSTSNTMHPGGFLSQLASRSTAQPSRRASDDAGPRIQRQSSLHDIPEASGGHGPALQNDPPPTVSDPPRPVSPAQDTTTRPHVFTHQKSHSLHHHFFSRGALFGSSGTLASPFAPRPTTAKAETVRESKRSTLDSPFQLAQPVPKRRRECDSILKTGFQNDDPFVDTGSSRLLPQVCLPSGSAHHRSRGFTVSAFGSNSNQELFPRVFHSIPRQHLHWPMETEGAAAATSLAPPPTLSNPPRLASPFRPDLHANTFPRNRPNNGLNDTVMTDAPSSPIRPSRYNPTTARRGLQGLFPEGRNAS